MTTALRRQISIIGQKLCLIVLKPETVRRRNRDVLSARYDGFVVGIARGEAEELVYHREVLQKQELHSHSVNQSWELVQLSPGKMPVASRWVFKLKRNETGDVVQHKAMFVAQGYRQRYYED